jgi:hypothetical protein
MSKCAQPGCEKAGIHRCSTCLRELYCSGECQKVDWKSHKLICKSLKKLSHELQPYNEVTRIIDEMSNESQKKIDLDVRILNHLISYAEHQIGDRIPGKDYRERANGDRISTWNVLGLFMNTYRRLNSVYDTDKSFSTIDSDNLRFPNLEKMLEFLSPWSVNLNLDSTGRIDNLNEGEIEHLLIKSSDVEL